MEAWMKPHWEALLTPERQSKPLTPAMKRALSTAAKRERGNICPIRGVWANAETKLLEAMDRRRLIAWDYPDKLNEHGIELLNALGRNP
jgi:hypothetical protein